MTWKVRIVKSLMPYDKEKAGMVFLSSFRRDVEMPFVPFHGLVYYEDRGDYEIEEEFEEVIWHKKEGIFEVFCGATQVDLDDYEEMLGQLENEGWESFSVDGEDRPNDIEKGLI